MYKADGIVWCLGSPAIGPDRVFWRGTLLHKDQAYVCKVVGDAPRLFHELLGGEERVLAVIDPTAIRPSVDAMSTPVWDRVLDIGLLVRCAVKARRRPNSRRRTVVNVLAKVMSHVSTRPMSVRDCEALLSGTKIPAAGTELSVGNVTVALYRMFRKIMRIARTGRDSRRWCRYELPVSRLLMRQSTLGVEFDSAQIDQACERLAPEVSALRLAISQSLGRDPLDLVRSSVARSRFLEPYIGLDRASTIAASALLPELESLGPEPEIAAKLVTLLKKRRSLEVLTRLRCVAEDECHARYDPHGTVTGRIIMRYPGLQWLSREYRYVVSAGSGRALRYLDYSCFEPSILATLARDPFLLDACRSDLYSQVGSLLGVSGEDGRNFAKRWFLAFMYGRSNERLAKDVVLFTRCAHEDALQRCQSVFDALAVSLEYRRVAEERAMRCGYAETSLGNRRVIAPRERYLTLNHVLQSTGSMIFKSALVRVLALDDDARLVVPMHDGLVVSIPEARASEFALQAEDAMKRAFVELIGDGPIRVKTSATF